MTVRLNGVWLIAVAGTPPVALGRGQVDDVEALVRGVIRSLTTTTTLTPDDELETMSHLFEQTVKLAAKYDPTRTGILFRPWLYQELQRDAIDFWRSFHGRKGEKRVADTERWRRAGRAFAGDGGFDDGDSGLDRPDVAAETGDDGAPGDRIFPREWVDVPGDRDAVVAGPLRGLCGGEGAPDPRRARRGGAAAGGRDERRSPGTDSGALAFLDCVICGWRSYAAHDRAAWLLPEACAGCGCTLELVPDFPPAVHAEDLAA